MRVYLVVWDGGHVVTRARDMWAALLHVPYRRQASGRILIGQEAKSYLEKATEGLDKEATLRAFNTTAEEFRTLLLSIPDTEIRL